MTWGDLLVFVVAVALIVVGCFSSSFLIPAAWQWLVASGVIILLGQGIYKFVFFDSF